MPRLNCLVAWGGIAIVMLITSACASLAPARTPPQIQHTPGAYVRLSENHFDAGIFQLDYPANWRIVKLSTADSNTIQVAIVAPDQSAVTLTQVENSDYSVLRLSNGIALAVAFQTSDAPDEGFYDHAKNLVSSIRA